MKDYPVHGSKSKVFSELLKSASTFSLEKKNSRNDQHTKRSKHINHAQVAFSWLTFTADSERDTVCPVTTSGCFQSLFTRLSKGSTLTWPCWWSLYVPPVHVRDLWRRTERCRTGSLHRWHVGFSSPLSAPLVEPPLLDLSKEFLWKTKVSILYVRSEKGGKCKWTGTRSASASAKLAQL